MPCDVCNTDHIVSRHHLSGERNLEPCVKALRGQLEELEEKAHSAALRSATLLDTHGAAIGKAFARIETLEGRLAPPTVRGEPFEAPPLPEGVQGVTAEELHHAVEDHLDAGGAVSLDPAPTATPHDAFPQV